MYANKLFKFIKEGKLRPPRVPWIRIELIIANILCNKNAHTCVRWSSCYCIFKALSLCQELLSSWSQLTKSIAYLIYCRIAYYVPATQLSEIYNKIILYQKPLVSSWQARNKSIHIKFPTTGEGAAAVSVCLWQSPRTFL